MVKYKKDGLHITELTVLALYNKKVFNHISKLIEQDKIDIAIELIAKVIEDTENVEGK